jgi:hypothetical protein
MPPRPLSLRALLFSWAALASLFCSGCSSEGPRDLNYGTDAGLGYVPPDAPVRADAAPDRSEAAAETDAGLDGASPYDTSVDAISSDDG